MTETTMGNGDKRAVACLDVEAVHDELGWTVRLADGAQTHVDYLWQVGGAARRLARPRRTTRSCCSIRLHLIDSSSTTGERS